MWKIFAVALTAFLFASTNAVAKDRPMVGFTSFGSARIGMSAEQLEAAISTSLIRMDPDSGEGSCYYVAPANDKHGVSFMLLDGHLARIDVSKPGTSTRSGATVGMSQQQVLQISGRVPTYCRMPTLHQMALTLLFYRQTKSMAFGLKQMLAALPRTMPVQLKQLST